MRLHPTTFLDNVVKTSEQFPPPPKPWTLKADISRQEIETWVLALGHYDNNEFDNALGDFDKISDTSKILFNMGVIHATLGEHEKAVCHRWPRLTYNAMAASL